MTEILQRMRGSRTQSRNLLLAMTVIASGLLLPVASANASKQASRRTTEQKSGTLPIRSGERVRIEADFGNVRVQTGPGRQVEYVVRIDTRAGDVDAENWLQRVSVEGQSGRNGVNILVKCPWSKFQGRLWVTIEVTIPSNSPLEVRTSAGNIETDDLDARISLITAGGNILTRNVGGSRAQGAHLESSGGFIRVGDVSGDLTAITAGGHVEAGHVTGRATLRTAGGHVRLASAGQGGRLETAAGNILIQRAGGSIAASTAGGRIDLGEIAGDIRARTSGGGIRVGNALGAAQVETSAGTIYLTGARGPVNATSKSGGIVAWITPEGKLLGPSQLVAERGDIVVYLPRRLGVTVDAVVENPTDYRIELDPALPLRVALPAGGVTGARHPIRAEGALNGGGGLLRLRAVSGNIRLRVADSAEELQERIRRGMMQQLEQTLQSMQIEIERNAEEAARRAREMQQRAAEIERRMQEEQRGRLERWRLQIEEMIAGSIKVDTESQQRRLTYNVRPVYPDRAKQNNLDGAVWLHLLIDKEGKVTNVDVISGHPWLAESAVAAVRQWRYTPTYLADKPVAVTTVLKVEFQLR